MQYSYWTYFGRGASQSEEEMWARRLVAGSSNPITRSELREVTVRGREYVLLRFSTSTAFEEVASTLYRETLWLVADHLGTPRIIVERTGSLSGIKRHDYLPFGNLIAYSRPAKGAVASRSLRNKALKDGCAKSIKYS